MHMKLIARPINITTELKVSDVGCIVIRTIFTCGVFCQNILYCMSVADEYYHAEERSTVAVDD